VATMPDRPNILLVMADQLVPFLTGAYGHPVVRTPALDRLAGDGMRFDAAAGRGIPEEDALRAQILAKFDPGAIAADGADSVRRRELIRRAMALNGTRWDHTPVFDATTQYVR